MNSLGKRICSALVFIPILSACIFSKCTIFLFLLISFIIFLGVLELYSLAARKQIKPFKITGVFTSLLLVTIAYLTPAQFYILSLVIISPLLVGCLVAIITKRYLLEIGVTLGGVIYIGYLFSHIFLIKYLQHGNYYLLLLFLITWITDTAALGVGFKFGRHKLVPHISPKKSVEGAIGGLIGSILIALLANLITGIFAKKVALSLNHILILGVILGVSGQIGDLLESKIKRIAEVKDSNTWIPGHGGVLDVFDSIIFNAPIIYWYAKFFLTS